MLNFWSPSIAFLCKFWLMVSITLLSFVKDSFSCSVNACNGEFVANSKHLYKGAFYPYCKQLDKYTKCVENQAKNCHGNLLYHGTKISVETLMMDNNCKDVLENQMPPDGGLGDPSEMNLSPGESKTSFTSFDPEEMDHCRYSGDPHPVHCGLFGDPHLKTFNGSFLTCRVQGAWPLISSSHLSVQITNEQVGLGSDATATTKVTVLINGQEECGKAKTYEASMEELPKAFVDGTIYSGIEHRTPYAQVKEVLPGSHVIISVMKINASVSIRRVGKYLTVSATLPRDIVSHIKKEGDIQLCEQGCPDTELLTTETKSGTSELAMSETKAEKLCSELNVTDFYLDSCVFDLATTGDLSFREAARLAQLDMWNSVPMANYPILRNCTEWPCMLRVTNGCHNKCVNFSGLLSAIYLFCVILKSNL